MLPTVTLSLQFQTKRNANKRLLSILNYFIPFLCLLLSPSTPKQLYIIIADNEYCMRFNLLYTTRVPYGNKIN